MKRFILLLTIIAATLFGPQMISLLANEPIPTQTQERYAIRGVVLDSGNKPVQSIEVDLVLKGPFSLDGGISVIHFPNSYSVLTDSNGSFMVEGTITELPYSPHDPGDSMAAMISSPLTIGKYITPFGPDSLTAKDSTYSTYYPTGNSHSCGCSTESQQYTQLIWPERIWEGYVIKEK